MDRDRLRYVLNLAGDYRVQRNGESVAGPPNHSVAVLLAGLVSRATLWSGRDELAARLYPDNDPAQARTALRQSLHRLRAWLGEDVLETETNRVRLRERWTLVTADEFGRPLSGLLLAPGLVHPWIDEMREEWNTLKPATPTFSNASFIAAVEYATRFDVDGGRALLIGGTAFVDSLGTGVLARLLSITRPSRPQAPLAEDHLLLEAWLHTYSGYPAQAVIEARRAFSLARRKGNPQVALKAKAHLLFNLIEAGDMDGAHQCYAALFAKPRRARSGLLQINAMAALAWNNHEMERALETMWQAAETAPEYDRLQQLHFFSNLAVLAAEAGALDKSQFADSEAQKLLVPGMDLVSANNLAMAAATRLIVMREPHEAVKILLAFEEQANLYEWRLSNLYGREARAEALAVAGERVKALRLWSETLGERRAAKLTLTPRLLARDARIRALV